MFLRAFVFDLFHPRHQPKVRLSARSIKRRAERSVDLDSLQVSEPLSKAEVAARCKAGRVAELSEHHA